MGIRNVRILLYSERVNSDHIETALPHSDFGEPDCCGCLDGVIRGDYADNRVQRVRRYHPNVPANELRRTLTEMELTLDLCSAVCPRCGSTNLFPGFSKITAFICKECGEAVDLSED